MKKIPTIFERDWNGDRSRVVDVWNQECLWVRDGEGFATKKIDGTCCMIRDGVLFKRREVKAGAAFPPDFIAEGTDRETGKSVGWVPVGDGPEDAAHREAWLPNLPSGTYELIGPKVQGNPEHAPGHCLVAHSDKMLLIPENAPRSFDALAAWLAGKDIEGVVFHHPDGRMAKIKLRDFGLRRP